MILVENLRKSFGSKNVLKGVDFSVNKGESFVIMGGSGSGKSVLIKCIIGLLDADRGSNIVIHGKNVLEFSRQERLRYTQNFGVLFQGGALFDSLKVWQNIAFAGLNNGLIDKQQAYKLAVEKLNAVGLGNDVADLYPVELSGGMQKRVALARAIALNPEVMFFDEPTAGLDPIMSGLISSLIRKCSRDLGATTITITHDMHCAEIVADNAALLNDGKFIWQGAGNEIKSSDNPYMQQFVYGKTEGPFALEVLAH